MTDNENVLAALANDPFELVRASIDLVAMRSEEHPLLTCEEWAELTAGMRAAWEVLEVAERRWEDYKEHMV